MLSIAGDVFYANGDYEQSALAYEECVNYSENPNDLVKAGIAYYKLGLKTGLNRISYLKRAKDLLEKAVSLTENVSARYYYALTLIELGEAKEAVENLSLIIDSIEDSAVASTIESYVFLSQLSLEADREAYQYIDDPFLISLYDFIKTRLPDEVFNRLKEKHNSDNKYVNLAKELNQLYSRFVINPEIKGVLKSPVERYILLLYVLLRGEESEDTIKLIKNRDFKKMPPYTRTIIKAFMDYMGFKEKEELPYFTQKDIEMAERIANLIKKIKRREVKSDALLRELKIIKTNLIDDKSVKNCENLIKELKESVPSSDEIVNSLKGILIKHLINTYVRITAFYEQKSSLSLFKSILSSLNIEDKIKMDVLSKL